MIPCRVCRDPLVAGSNITEEVLDNPRRGKVCRPCEARRAREWRAANRERAREIARAGSARYADAHPEAGRARGMTYRERHAEALLERSRRSREELATARALLRMLGVHTLRDALEALRRKRRA